MADLAALRGTDAANLARGERGEVVLVHVALGIDGRQVVDLLLHAQHGQGGHAQDLGLTALEQGGAVHAGQDLNLGGERTDLARGTAIHADLFTQGAITDRGLLERTERGLEGLLRLGEALGKSLEHLFLDGIHGLVAGELALGQQRLSDLLGGVFLDSGVFLVGVVQEQREVGGLLGGLLGDLDLSLAQGLDEGLCSFEAVGHNIFGGGGSASLNEIPLVLAAAGLDHHDRDVFGAVLLGDDAARDNDVEHGTLELAPARERDPLAVDQGQASATDRAGERQASDLGGHGGGVDRQDVVGVIRVDRQDGLDDLNLVTQALDEAGAQRAVDEAGGQDGLGARAAFAAEEGTGDATRGVLTLFNVNGQREEIELVLGVLANGRGRQNGGGIIQVGQSRAGGLLGETAGFEAHDALAETAVIDNRLCGDDVRAFHHGAFLLGLLVSRSTSAFDRSPRINAPEATVENRRLAREK